MPQKAQKKAKPEEYRGWRLRFIEDRPDGRQPIWQADNNDIHNRKRISGVTRTAVFEAVDKWLAEREKHGTAHSLDDGAREATLRAMRELGERATLDEIVQFWKDRHPVDGNRITLGDMVEQFIEARVKLGNRPTTVHELRWKLAAFVESVGSKTPLSGIGDEEVERFVAGRKGSATTIRSWKKALSSFFRYCREDCKAIKTNPVEGVKVPKSIRKLPTVWTARDVESFMRIAEQDAPDMVAGFAVLWFAGLRPTELAGQYGLEHEKITEAKLKLAQVRTNYEAERMRLGLGQGRGGHVQKKAAAQAILNESPQAKALKDVREHLAAMQKRHGGEAMAGLQWADVCLDDEDERFISIRAETSKTQERRHVEILPNLEAWLTKYRKVGGPVVANPTAFRRARERILSKMGDAKWAPDVCRHSFASYFYKAHGDRDRLAAMMGHSAMSREIEKHYKDATVSRADAEKFWQIAPDGMTLADTTKRKAKKGA